MDIVDNVKSKYNTVILTEMDAIVRKSVFSFDALYGTLDEYQLPVLQDALEIYKRRNKVRVCRLCQRSELMIDDWYNNAICTGCYHRRNNKSRIKEWLHY